MYNSVKQIIMLGLEKNAVEMQTPGVKSVMSTPSISVNGAVAAPTSVPSVTPQSADGTGTLFTQQPAVPPAAPPPAQATPAKAPPAQAPPAQAPPAQQQQPPNTANMNLTQDYTPLGADQTAAVMAGNMKPETFTAGISLLNQINLGEEVPPELLKQTQDAITANLDPQYVGAQVVKHKQGRGLDPARTKEIVADEARQRGVPPEQAEQDPNFMQMLGKKWEGMDDTQKIGLAVGIPMALIGLFSGAMGGNKWIAGILGLAGAAGVGHSMGAFDKLIPGWDKMQKGMKTLDTTMAEIEQMPEGDVKNYMISRAYQQAREQGGGSFSVASLMPTTSANRLSSAYGQIDHANMPSYDRSTPQGMYDEFEMAQKAYNQLKPGDTRDLVRNQMMTAANQQKDVQRLNSMMEAASQLKPSPEKDHFIRQIHAAANQGEAQRGYALMSQMEGTPAHQLAKDFGSLGEAPELDDSANLNMSLNVWESLPEGRAKDDYLKEINQRVRKDRGLGIAHGFDKYWGTVGRMFGYEDSPLNRLQSVNYAKYMAQKRQEEALAAKNKQPQ